MRSEQAAVGPPFCCACPRGITAGQGDLALRSLAAIESGLIQGTVQTARELGASKTSARQLERDLNVLAIVAATRGGSGFRGGFGRGKFRKRRGKPIPEQNTKHLGKVDPGDPNSTSLPRKGNRQAINQGSEPTCGSVCAGMVLDTFGKKVDLDLLAKQSKVDFSGKGTNLLNVRNALIWNGISSARLRVNPTIHNIAEATKNRHPAIIQVMIRNNGNKGGHAIVVDGVIIRDGKKVFAIRDPAGGRTYFSPAEEIMEKMKEIGSLALFTNPKMGGLK